MAGAKTLRVEADAWTRLQESARGGSDDGLAGILAEHLIAPVKALLVTTQGDRGVRTRLTMVRGELVLVTQRMALVDGETRIEPGAQITFSDPEALWPALARTLPDMSVLRAPADAVANEPDRRLTDLTPEGVAELLGREEANLQVSVEAYREGGVPAVQWGRLWSVVDGRLIDVRTRDGEVRLVERPAGSVAKELRWALVGAVDATTRVDERGGGRPRGSGDGVDGSEAGA
ncbi:hypothetical protein [Promicromonospora sp. NPDC023805]|uniref:hypothetical protein n=1 Tax=Promicromonospora sp. NPDC023805 TaxID=3154696 RepID=UPI0033FD1A60